MSSSTVQGQRPTDPFRPTPVEVKYASPGTPASPVTPSKVPPGMALGAASAKAAWLKVNSDHVRVSALAAEHALGRVRNGNVTRSTSGSDDDDCKSTDSLEKPERPNSCPPTERTEKVAQILNRVTEQAKDIADQRAVLDAKAKEISEQRRALLDQARPFLGLQSIFQQMARESKSPILNYKIKGWQFDEDNNFRIEFSDNESFSLFLTDSCSSEWTIRKYEDTLTIFISQKGDTVDVNKGLRRLSQIFGDGFESMKIDAKPFVNPNPIKVKTLVPVEALSDLTLDDLAKLSHESLKETLNLLKGYLKV